MDELTIADLAFLSGHRPPPAGHREGRRVRQRMALDRGARRAARRDQGNDVRMRRRSTGSATGVERRIQA